MPARLRVGFFLHSIRSDWNNGNAHFLRGLVRAMGQLDHRVTVFEQENNWSVDNLVAEERCGSTSLEQFAHVYSDISVNFYQLSVEDLRPLVADLDVVIVHEWNPPELIDALLTLREEHKFATLFHDTHHRASSTPDAIKTMQVTRFDGVLVFGESLRLVYQRDFRVQNVWTLHEAADTSVFYPREALKTTDVVWIGNWGDDERSTEIKQFLVRPAARAAASTTIYGVRYPEEALNTLANARIRFGGYLPNLDAPATYASARLTLHIPRQQYSRAVDGVPTIRVFEALASGIPLISAPWRDTEQLFCPGDFCWAGSEDEMTEAMSFLIGDSDAARRQADQGLSTVLKRHTCAHRAAELTAICEEVLAR